MPMMHKDRADKAYRHRTVGDHALRPETLMMGYGYDPQLSEGAVKCPIFQTSTFAFRSAEDGKAFFEAAYGLRPGSSTEEPGLIYSRINNPDLQILEERLTLWENAEAALAFSSGMSAISTTLLTFLRPGDVLVHSDPLYGGTEFLIDKVLPAFGVQGVSFAAGYPGRTLDEALALARERGRCPVIFFETPANPTNGLVDIGHCAAAAASAVGRQAGARPLVVVDNTFLGPLVAAPPRARRRHRRLLADEVRRRAQRPGGRRLPRERARSSRRSDRCARSSARPSTRTPGGCCCAASRR
jgi:methionine-gamma-lyase